MKETNKQLPVSYRSIPDRKQTICLSSTLTSAEKQRRSCLLPDGNQALCLAYKVEAAFSKTIFGFIFGFKQPDILLQQKKPIFTNNHVRINLPWLLGKSVLQNCSKVRISLYTCIHYSRNRFSDMCVEFVRMRSNRLHMHFITLLLTTGLHTIH